MEYQTSNAQSVPLGMSKAAMPLEAIVSTISPLDRKADERALHIVAIYRLSYTVCMGD